MYVELARDREAPILELRICMLSVNSTGVFPARLFGHLLQACIGFTKKQDNQIKQTCYAQASQIRAVRKKMCDIMMEEASKCDLRELVLKL